MKMIKRNLMSLTSALLFTALMSLSVFAHIQTDSSSFPDIKSSEARFDITVLVGAGVIPETSVFEPKRKFSRSDLAAWSALSASLLEKFEGKPDVNALAKAALDKGLVKSLEGDATYADINVVFFQGKNPPAQPEAVPTRAEAASYIVTGLVTPVAGSLLEKSGQHAGPTGVVAKVEARANADGGESVFITIGEQTLPMYTHGRVGNGPSELAKWSGRTVRRSFIRTQGEFSTWAYLESETVAGDADEPAHDHSTHKHADEETPAKSGTDEHAEHKHAE